MLPNGRLIALTLALGAVLVVTLLTASSGALLAVEETPAPLPPPVTPTPGPTTSGPSLVNPTGGPVCSAQGAYPAGQIVDVLNLRIRLPATGTYNVNFGIADPGGEFIRVCYVEGNAAIFFARDGRETSRRLSDSSAPSLVTPVFDEIARNVQLLSPPPTPQPRCHGRGATTGAPHVQVGGIAFDLPPGDFVITRNNDEFATVSICYIQGNVAMLMHTIACSVLSRDTGSTQANAVLDQIVRSCTVTATPALPQPNTPVRGAIRPPDTGDAGLVAR